MFMENMGNEKPRHALKLDILPDAQRRLWQELSATPEQFVLYGGTAIALRLGHRQSVDFDFFAFQNIDPQSLLDTIPYLKDAIPIQRDKNTLTVRIDRQGSVQVSYIGLPNLSPVQPPLQLENPKLKLADLLDLAATKMAVVQQRAAAKDYLDVHAMLTQTDISLTKGLAAAGLVYGNQFNAILTLKALAYFAEPELAGLPEDVKTTLTRAASHIDLNQVVSETDALKQNK